MPALSEVEGSRVLCETLGFSLGGAPPLSRFLRRGGGLDLHSRLATRDSRLLPSLECVLFLQLFHRRASRALESLRLIHQFWGRFRPLALDSQPAIRRPPRRHFQQVS